MMTADFHAMREIESMRREALQSLRTHLALRSWLDGETRLAGGGDSDATVVA